jgi:hypothetical protein
MRCVSCGILLALIACGGPSVRVVIDLPASHKSHVETVLLRVLEPPSTAPFDCESLVYGDVDDTTLRLSQTQPDIPLTKDSAADLSGIARKGLKLFWVEGLDKERQVVVAGCGSQGDISQEVTVEIKAQPATLVSWPFDSGPPVVRATVSDIYKAALQQTTDVRWTVVGGKGIACVVTNAVDGNTARIDMSVGSPDWQSSACKDETPLIGPLLVDVRAPWQVNELAHLWSNVLPGEPFRAESATCPQNKPTLECGFIGNAFKYVVGRIGPNGEMGFAVLLLDGAQVKLDLMLFKAAPAGDPSLDFDKHELTLSGGAETMGLVPLASRDQLVIVTAAAAADKLQWVPVTVDTTGDPHLAAGTDLQRPTSGPPGTTLRATGFFSLAPCQAASNGSILVSFEPPAQQSPLPPSRVLAVNPEAPVRAISTNLGMNPQGGVVDAGCLAESEGAQYPALVYPMPGPPGSSGGHQVEIVRNGVKFDLEVPLLTHSFSVRLAPAFGPTPPYLMAANIMPQGSFLDRYWISAFNEGPKKIQIDRVMYDSIASTPQSVASGNLDGDDKQDVVLVQPFGTGTPTEQNTEFNLLLILGAEFNGQRVAGLLGKTVVMEQPQVLLADFDGDGFDDILVGERASDGTSNTSVYRMGLIVIRE